MANHLFSHNICSLDRFGGEQTQDVPPDKFQLVFLRTEQQTVLYVWNTMMKNPKSNTMIFQHLVARFFRADDHAIAIFQ